MKKLAFFIAAASLCFVLTVGCKTAPKSAEEAFKNIYERYYADLILDGAETYTVQSGDTLAHIARSSEYNSGFYYPIIMLASKDVVLDPDKIEVGMELIIPDLQKNLDNPRSRASIKKFLGEVAKIEDDRERAETANGLRNLAASI